MKTFLALGVLCLLFCLAWVQEKQVDTRCTENVLWVFVKKDLFGDGVLVQAEELKLGTGCPVTTELPDKFELQYLVRYCGIKKMAFETYTRFECILHYVRTNRTVYRPPLEFPLTCIFHRKQRFRTIASAPIPTPMTNQSSGTNGTEHSVSRFFTSWRPDFNHPQGKSLIRNLRPPRKTRGLLLIPHFISVIFWKQGQRPCPGISCHKVCPWITRAENFSLFDLGPKRIRAPCSLVSDILTSFLPPVIDQESSVSTAQDDIIGLFYWIPLLGAEFFFYDSEL